MNKLRLINIILEYCKIAKNNLTQLIKTFWNFIIGH